MKLFHRTSLTEGVVSRRQASCASVDRGAGESGQREREGRRKTERREERISGTSSAAEDPTPEGGEGKTEYPFECF